MFDFVITPAVIIGGVNTLITVGKSLYGMRQLNSFESLVKQLDSVSVIVRLTETTINDQLRMLTALFASVVSSFS
jgi:hypothetical protein